MTARLLALVVLFVRLLVAGPAGAAGASGPCSRQGDTAPTLERTDPAVHGRIALTFDDGPHPTYTPRTLDALRARGLHATFFVVGRAITRKTFRIVQRIVEEGHILGSHSYSHDVEMASRYPADVSLEYVVGQHSATEALVDVALLATSPADFDELVRRVFRLAPFEHARRGDLVHHERFEARWAELLAERGYPEGEHVYRMVYARPPGGGPYLTVKPTRARQVYDEAMARLGLVNVLWHDAAGDTDADQRADVEFLLGNLGRAARRGGVVLLHDGIVHRALVRGLGQLSADRRVSFVGLDQLVREKYGCVAASGRAPTPRSVARVTLDRAQGGA